MAGINSVNDPGFLATLAGQAAQKSPYAADRAASRALGLGRQLGAGPQLQAQSPYFLNPGSAPMTPMGTAPAPAFGELGAARQLVTPGAPARAMVPQSQMFQGTPFPGQGTLPPSGGVLPTGGGPIPQGPVMEGPGVWGSAGKVGAQSADDVLLGQAASGTAAGQAAGVAGAAEAGIAGEAAAAASVAAKQPFLSAANITKGTMMKGAGVAATGYAISGFLDSMNIGGEQSLLDKAGSSSIMGAGFGAGAAMALGLGTGPVGWAALGGAALFATGRMLFGGDKSSLTKAKDTAADMGETIQSLGSSYGLDDTAMSDIMMQYNASTGLYINNKDKDGLKTYLAGLSATLPALMLQAKEEQKAKEQEDQRFQGMLATQAQFAPIFAQSLGQAQQASAGAMATANEVSQRLEATSPNLANLMRSGAAVSNDNANRLYAGYAAQMAMGPQAQYNAHSANVAGQAQDLAAMKQQMQQQSLLDQYMQSAAV